MRRKKTVKRAMAVVQGAQHLQGATRRGTRLSSNAGMLGTGREGKCTEIIAIVVVQTAPKKSTNARWVLSFRFDAIRDVHV